MTWHQKAKKASVTLLIATALGKGLTIFGNIGLAWLLSPEDFGNLTIALLFTEFLGTIGNIGFQTYLIQSQEETDDVVQTTFYLQFLFALTLSLLLFASTFIFTSTFKNPQVVLMLRCYCPVILFEALGQAPLGLLKRRIDFHLSARAEITGSITSNAAKVVFAFFGLHALSFPLGDMCGALVKVVLAWSVAGFRPAITHFSRAKALAILKFGGFVATTNLAAYFARQTDKMFLSAHFSEREVGYYTFGYGQASIFLVFLEGSLISLFISFYAKLREDHATARESVTRIAILTNYVAMPFYAFCACFPDLVLHAVFGRTWLPAVFFFRIFCLDFLLRTFFTSITSIQMSFGMAGGAARTKMINSALFVVSAALASTSGNMQSYALAFLFASVLGQFNSFSTNARIISLPIGTYIRGFIPNLATVVPSIIVSVALRNTVKPLPVFVGMCALGSIFLILYAITSWWTNREVMRYVVGQVSGLIGSRLTPRNLEKPNAA